MMCQQGFLQVWDLIPGSTQLEHSLVFVAPSSLVQKPVGVGYPSSMHDGCFVAGTRWRGQWWKQTYLHYSYNPAISGFGWGPTIHVNIPHIQTWAENMMSQVFAAFLILNWECQGVWRRWKWVLCFQAVLCALRGKMHQRVHGRQRCMDWKSFFSIRSFCIWPHGITAWIWGACWV